MIRSIFAILLAFTLFSQPARAALDEKGAQDLKAMFESMLKDEEIAMATRGGKLVKDGQLTVEPSGNYYAVTLPHLSMQFEDGSHVDIGMIAVNAMPGNTPDEWKMTMAIPTPIIFYDAAQKPEVTVDIGQQNFGGIWHKKFNNYVKLQAQYKNTTVKMADGSFTATLPDFTAVYNLNDDGAGLWSGPMSLVASGLNVVMNDGGTASIGKISAIVNVLAYSLNDAAAYQEKMNALTESYNAGEESANPSHVSGVYNLVMEFIGTVWDGFTMDMTAEGIHMTRPPLAGSPAGSLDLAKCGMTFGLNGFRQGNVTMQLGLNYADFAIAPLPEEFDETTPTSASVDLRLNNLPFRALADLGKTSLDSAAKMPDAGMMVGMQALMSLPQIMTQAQTNLTVSRTYFGNKDYNVKINGTVKPDPAAQMSATGTANVEITGFEKILGIIGAKLKDPATAPEKAAKLQEMQSLLTMLQMAGQQQAGGAARTYNMELNQQGQVLINGTDMSVLMGQGQAQQAPALQAPPQ